MLIDFHTHCFPEGIAQRALAKLSNAAGGMRPNTDGTLNGIKEQMLQQAVDISVVLNIATNERQQKSVNDFAAQMNDAKTVFGFGSVFPDAPDVIEELERIRFLGLKGVKLHPDYQGFEADDPKMKKIYKKISELGLITVFHAGFDYGFPPPYGGTPKKLLKALSWFDSPVVAAHWGGLSCWDEVLEHLCGRELYFDTSFACGCMPKYYAQKIIEKHGADRVLFGTDTPWHTPAAELGMLATLELSNAEIENITFTNAAKLLEI